MPSESALDNYLRIVHGIDPHQTPTDPTPPSRVRCSMFGLPIDAAMDEILQDINPYIAAMFGVRRARRNGKLSSVGKPGISTRWTSAAPYFSPDPKHSCRLWRFWSPFGIAHAEYYIAVVCTQELQLSHLEAHCRSRRERNRLLRYLTTSEPLKPGYRYCVLNGRRARASGLVQIEQGPGYACAHLVTYLLDEIYSPEEDV